MAELNDSAGSPFANVFFATMDSDYTSIIQINDLQPDTVTIVEPPPLASGQIGNLGEYNIKDTWGRTWQS